MGYVTSALVLIGLFLVTEIIHIIRAVIWYVRYYKLKYSERLSSTIAESIPDKKSRPISVAVVTDGGATRLFCRKCGKEIPNDSAFCPKCGERVLSIPSKNVISAENKEPEQSKGNPEQLKALMDKTPIIAIKSSERLCTKCGNTIFSTNVVFCPYCSERLPTPLSKS